mmetsp:Transcript_116935/g.377368  ORF Transcript_116935/g.377368 Transcript_116935/m.377368 type:complete len:262 (-) Transcript_116935:835-1620(-)
MRPRTRPSAVLPATSSTVTVLFALRCATTALSRDAVECTGMSLASMRKLPGVRMTASSAACSANSTALFLASLASRACADAWKCFRTSSSRWRLRNSSTLFWRSFGWRAHIVAFSAQLASALPAVCLASSGASPLAFSRALRFASTSSAFLFASSCCRRLARFSSIFSSRRRISSSFTCRDSASACFRFLQASSRCLVSSEASCSCLSSSGCGDFAERTSWLCSFSRLFSPSNLALPLSPCCCMSSGTLSSLTSSVFPASL